MKDLFKSGVIVLIIIGVLYLIFLRECKKTDCPPKGYVLVWSSTWDSVNKMLLRPPEIKIIKEYIKGETVYVDRPVLISVPDPQDTTIKVFHDSIKNEKIDAWVDFKLRGELLDFRWGYVPITTTITLEKTKYVPKIVDRPIPVPQDGFYLSGVLGGRAGMPIMFGGNIDLITKSGGMYGLQYQRMGRQNFYSFRLGAKIVL